MCGIVGSASTEKMKSRSERYSFMKVGLDLDSWRGWESTGIACVPEGEKDSPIIYKRAINGRDFINCKETERLLGDIEKYPVVIGHNRAATTGRGNIVDHNAHPFQYGKITLVHNGHIRNCHELGDATKGADCAVDSAQVAYAMENLGEKETLESCEGGFCFVWWNNKTRLLNIARNNERPMHWAYAAKENTLFFASEPTQLLHLLRDVEIDEDKGILYPDPWVWYQFNLSNLREYTKVPFAHRQGRRLMKGTSDQSGQNRGGPTNEELAAWESEAAEARTVGKSTKESLGELEEIRKDIADTRLKEAKACGIPTTEKRMKLAKQRLSRLGFVFQEFRVCTPDSWVKYKNQDNLGACIARTRREGHIVEIGGVRFQDYEIFRRIKTVLIEAVNVRRGPTGNEERIVGIVSPRMKAYLLRREVQVKEEEKRDPKEDPSIDLICRGPHNQSISLAKWYELTDKGCSSCTCDLFAQDCEDVLWVQEFPICGTCSKDPSVMELLGVPEHARASGVH